MGCVRSGMGKNIFAVHFKIRMQIPARNQGAAVSPPPYLRKKSRTVFGLVRVIFAQILHFYKSSVLAFLLHWLLRIRNIESSVCDFLIVRYSSSSALAAYLASQRETTLVLHRHFSCQLQITWWCLWAGTCSPTEGKTSCGVWNSLIVVACCVKMVWINENEEFK